MPMAMEHQTTAPNRRMKSVLAKQCSAVWRLLSDGRWEVIHVASGTDIGQIAQIAELFASICVGQLNPGTTVTARFGEDMVIAQVDEHGVLVSMKERGGNPLMIKTAMSRLETRSQRSEGHQHTAKTAAGTAGSGSTRSATARSPEANGPGRSEELERLKEGSAEPTRRKVDDLSVRDVEEEGRREEEIPTSEPKPPEPNPPKTSSAKKSASESEAQISSGIADEAVEARVETPQPQDEPARVESPAPEPEDEPNADEPTADEAPIRSSRTSTRSARARKEIDLVAFEEPSNESGEALPAEGGPAEAAASSQGAKKDARGGFDRENSLAFEIVFAEEDESSTDIPSIASSQFVDECCWADVQTFFEEAITSAADYLGRAVSANYWNDALSDYRAVDGRITFGAMGRISTSKPKLMVSPKEAEALSRAVDDWKARAARVIGNIDEVLPQLDVQPWRAAHSREEK